VLIDVLLHPSLFIYRNCFFPSFSCYKFRLWGRDWVGVSCYKSWIKVSVRTPPPPHFICALSACSSSVISLPFQSLLRLSGRIAILLRNHLLGNIKCSCALRVLHTLWTSAGAVWIRRLVFENAAKYAIWAWAAGVTTMRRIKALRTIWEPRCSSD